MPTCFVIQPFDSDRFDKRFDETYGPALEQAGLEPYRVDRDPAVEVTIDSIHDGIRAAAMCLADITTDNPNVWYELGFALALDRDVILICSDERGTKYPFDIQHRNIIQYGTGSRGDYDTLHRSISERAQALLEKEPRSRRETERDALQGTLSESEIAVLIVAAENIAVPGERLLANALKGNVERSGLAAAGYGAAISRLQQRGFLKVVLDDELDGYTCHTVALTDSALMWITKNERLFSEEDARKNDGSESFEDDVPF